MAVASIKGSAGGYQTWTRPADWLALPAVNVGDQKIVALVHVLPSAANTLISFTVAGACSIDWGDGTAVQNVATGVQVTHSYDPTTLSGATLTSDGYRQAVLTITMQAANTLTSFVLATPTGASAGYVQQIREVTMAGASLSTLTIGSAVALRWFTYVGPSAIVTMNVKFQNNVFLRGVSGTQWTAGVGVWTFTFAGCVNLETVPLLDTSAATDMTSCFQSCTRLRSIPLLNTGNVTNFANMFNGCQNLSSVPLFDTSKGTSFSGMFSTCVSLTTIPLLNTALGTNFSSMFTGCALLASVPALNVANGTTFASMFSVCSSLTTFAAALNTIKGTDFTSMFQSCLSLNTHPTLDCSNGITFGNMFQGCNSLTGITLNSPKATTFANLAFSCPSLRTLSIDCTLIPSTAATNQLFSGTVALTSVILTGLRFATASFATQQLSAAAMNALYTSLGTASGAQTLIVSGNPGSGSSTIATATAKGWTVTGG